MEANRPIRSPKLSTGTIDIPRAPQTRRTRLLIVGAVAACGAIAVGAWVRTSSTPRVDRATLWIDSVRHGDMIREVRAPGTLNAEQLHLIAAPTAGRIDAVFVRPGQAVVDTSALVTLTNPDVELEALAADQQAGSAEGALVALMTTLATQRIGQETELATAEGDEITARRSAAAIAVLGERGFATRLDVQAAQDKASTLARRAALTRDQLALVTRSAAEQIQLQKLVLARLRSIAAFQRARLLAMHVLAGGRGVVQEAPVALGQWMNAGALLAKVVDPTRIKIVLRLPATDARDIVVGAAARVDTHNGIVTGRVAHIDPSVSDGTVGVDVTPDGPLPPGSRVDMAVDGTISVDHLHNVLYINRPAGAAEGSVVPLYVLSTDGGEATLTQVRLGRLSATTAEITGGLAPGAHVIVSDMSAWGSAPRVAIR